MKTIILNPQETEELEIRDALVNRMTPPMTPEKTKKLGLDDYNESKEIELYEMDKVWWDYEISLYSEEQLNVFRCFLEFMSEYFPSPFQEGDALEEYWGRLPSKEN